MPIAYSCPHCDKQFSVDEQYAGQTGPCAACGQTITIPGAPPQSPQGYAPRTAASTGTGTGLLVVVLGVIGMMVVCGGVLLALLLPAMQAAREAARRAQSTNNLQNLTLALQVYSDQYNTFPPAVVTDASGQPLYSGRVLLLPFLEQKALYDQFDLSKAWDSPENMALSQTSIRVFMDPSSINPAPGKTDYLFVTGKGTIFEADKAVKLQDILDGTSNTLVFVECENSDVSWAEPKDLDIIRPMSLPPGNHSGGNIAASADGSVRVIPSNTAPTAIHSMATRAGGEPPPP